MAKDPVERANERFLPDDFSSEGSETNVRSADAELVMKAIRTPQPRLRPIFRWLPIVLFFATCLTTCWAGYSMLEAPLERIDPATGKITRFVQKDQVTGKFFLVKDEWKTIQNGMLYAIAVMTVLAAHEAGHYFQARRHEVPASLPMFIPMPFGPLGTMGAVIFQEPGVADRKALFDIAITGPLAGLAIALPLNWWGVQHSVIGPVQPGAFGFTNPQIVEWMISWIHRPLLPGEDISLNPILHAGWVGIFITALNLTPIGQLDGGHVLYCLIGKRAHLVARTLWIGAVAIVAIQIWRGHYEYIGWTLMLTLLWLMGTRHPPTADDRVPLGWPRMILGWLTLCFIFVGFVPTPMYVGPSRAPAAAAAPAGPLAATPAADSPVQPAIDQTVEKILPDSN